MDKETYIKELYKQGFSYTEIGSRLGVSRQRIHQILRDYHNTGRQNRLEKYRDWGPCKVCEDNVAKDLHHIDFNNSNDEIENLIQVCKSCHYKLHTGRRSQREYPRHRRNPFNKNNIYWKIWEDKHPYE